MDGKIKSQIPLEDRVLLNNLMFRVWKDDDIKALNEVTVILATYSAKGFNTTPYALELLKYYTSKKEFVLREDLT